MAELHRQGQRGDYPAKTIAAGELTVLRQDGAIQLIGLVGEEMKGARRYAYDFRLALLADEARQVSDALVELLVAIVEQEAGEEEEDEEDDVLDVEPASPPRLDEEDQPRLDLVEHLSRLLRQARDGSLSVDDFRRRFDGAVGHYTQAAREAHQRQLAGV